MKKVYTLLFLLAMAIPFIGLSQADLVITGTTPVYMVESGGSQATPIYIEIHNSANTAIKVNGSLGWIISESEFNMVKWDIGLGTAGNTYTIPFGYSTLYYIPLSFKVITAGTSLTPTTAGIKFSTYHTPADQQANTPSDVTGNNMLPSVLPGLPTNTDNSYNVVDRFWVIDAATGAGGYTARPQPNITFKYLDGFSALYAHSEVNTPNNFTAGTETNLIAQRWNSTLNTWGDYHGSAGTVVAGPPIGLAKNDAALGVSSADFFRSWTLSNSVNPLPIELTEFNVACNNGAATITWTTGSEINNDHFTVERSTDGVDYETVATVPGAGNSTTAITYSATDPNPLPGTSYYRLSQTDYDGNVNNFSPVSFSGCQVDGITVGAFLSNGNSGRMIVRLNAPMADNYEVTLVSTLGQVLLHESKSLPAGYNEFTLNQGNLTYGIYMLNVRSNNTNYSKKFVLGAW